MNLEKKRQIAVRAIESISLHFDETPENVNATLDGLVEFIGKEKAAFADRKAAHEAAEAAKVAARAAPKKEGAE